MMIAEKTVSCCSQSSRNKKKCHSHVTALGKPAFGDCLKSCILGITWSICKQQTKYYSHLKRRKSRCGDGLLKKVFFTDHKKSSKKCLLHVMLRSHWEDIIV